MHKVQNGAGGRLVSSQSLGGKNCSTGKETRGKGVSVSVGTAYQERSQRDLDLKVDAALLDVDALDCLRAEPHRIPDVLFAEPRHSVLAGLAAGLLAGLETAEEWQELRDAVIDVLLEELLHHDIRGTHDRLEEYRREKAYELVREGEL